MRKTRLKLDLGCKCWLIEDNNYEKKLKGL